MYYVKRDNRGVNMATTMVTARMDEVKKSRATAILRKHGKTPSDAINELYDFIIKENALPWKKETGGISAMSENEIAEAKDFLTSIQVCDSRFATMTDKDIKKERLQARGLV